MIYASLFSTLCFLLSSFGASMVFFIRKASNKTNAFLHAFSSGVMIASSIFSLLIPAIEYCTELNLKDYFILPISFLLGYFVIVVLDKLNKESGSGKINTRLVSLGMCLHNIPEGMCVGFAFASASVLGTRVAFVSAVMIAVGIGIQNIPEGMSVAFPKVCGGSSKLKAFLTGSLMAIVEIPSAIIAYLIGLEFLFILPYMLAFSASIMIFVSCLDLMPEAVHNNKKIALFSLFIGFVLMMLLDLAL